MSLSDPALPPARDEIMDEVRSIRDALSAECDHDMRRLFEAAKRWEAESDRPKVASSSKRLSPAASG